MYTTVSVVVYHADRCIGIRASWRISSDLCPRASVTKLATVSGDLDLSTHEGQLITPIPGAVALEGERRQEPPHPAQARRARALPRQASRVAASHPYGYEPDQAHPSCREEADGDPRVARARRWPRDSLAPSAGLQRRAASRPSPAKPWAPPSLARILIVAADQRRARIIARSWRWRSGRRSSPPRESAAACARSCGDPERRTNRRRPPLPLDRGFLRCRHCGPACMRDRVPTVPRRYVCASGPGFGGCGKTTIIADPLELFILGRCAASARVARAARGITRLVSHDAAIAASGRPRPSAPRRSWTSSPRCGPRANHAGASG